jgi:hypothetical protein
MSGRSKRFRLAHPMNASRFTSVGLRKDGVDGVLHTRLVVGDDPKQPGVACAL